MQKSSTTRRIIQSATLIFSNTAFGVLGFHYLEGWPIIDSFYTTVITLSTVGYGLEYPLSPDGKIFVIIFITTTVGTFLYAVSSFSAIIIEGELSSVIGKYQDTRKIMKMKDHYVVCGFSRVGEQIANELEQENRTFVVIERNPEKVTKNAWRKKNIQIIQGDATNEMVLRQAHIENAAGLLAALPSDADNVFITLTAKELNPSLKIVSRASEEINRSKMITAGANHVIVPNKIAGKRMSQTLTKPFLTTFVSMITGSGKFSNYELEEIRCVEYPKLLGRTLEELSIRRNTGALVLAHVDDHDVFNLNPPHSVTLDENDEIIVMGTREQLLEFKTFYS